MSGSLRFGPPKGGWPNFTQDGNESVLEVPYFERPASQSPRLSVKELREGGYLHEVNRLFFHPLGLAMVVEPDTDTVWISDCRDDPEGVYYGDDLISVEKYEKVKAEWHARREARFIALGYITQPVNPDAYANDEYRSKW